MSDLPQDALSINLDQKNPGDKKLNRIDSEDKFVFRRLPFANQNSNQTKANKVNPNSKQGELSRCSTTSEVDSDDDAVSLASRLSQIVLEQETQSKDHVDSKLQSRNEEHDESDTSESYPQRMGTIKVKQLQQQQQQQQQNKSTNSHGPKIEVTDFEYPPDKKMSNQIYSNNKTSYQENISADKLDNTFTNKRTKIQDNNDSNDHYFVDLPEQHFPRNHDRLPERGNLKTLENNRQQHQNKNVVKIMDKQLKIDDSAKSNRTRALTLTNSPSQPNISALFDKENQDSYYYKDNDDYDSTGEAEVGGDQMLNIRRSTWTLSEFDDTFNKFNERREPKNVDYMKMKTSQASLGDSTLSLPALQNLKTITKPLNSASSSMDPLGFPMHTTNGLARNQCNDRSQVSSYADFGDENLLFKAAMNSCSQTGSINHISSDPNLKDRRPSFTQSIASLASSIEQTMVPSFGRKRKKGKQRKEDVQYPHQENNCKSSISGIGKRNSRRRDNDDGDGDGGFEPKCDSGSSFKEKKCCSILSCLSNSALSQYIPIIDWLPNYSSSYIYGDIVAGITVAVLNISTSLSAAVVAETDLGVAFKTSIVNTLIYSILCSSRHTSFGSYSIMSQMLLVSVQRALSDELILSRLNLGPAATWKANEYEHWHLNIIVMFTFLIGLIQLACGLLNLGYIVASFIPEALSSSMIAATAFTMAIGQFANMCGTSNKILWSIEKNTTELWADLKDAPVDITDLFANLFRWVQQIALLIRYYDQINLVCVLISFISVLVLCLNQYFIQTNLKKIFKRDILIPIEMILLMIMIICSYAFDLNQSYQVPTCGPIEIDFKIPDWPNLRLVRELWFQSMATALISYTTVHIMSKTYSNKCNYEVDSNQELIACGAGNLIGGLFDAMPAAASFSRTAGQVEAGGQTQMASIVNCVVLVFMTHFLGQHVAALPVSVMAATLFFGFVRMMNRITDAPKYWRTCKVDFSIWLVTFIAILATDLVSGFVYGFIFSILTLLYRAQNRRCYMLGNIPGSPDVFVPLRKYPMARELDRIKIFQYCGPINYVSEELFERLLRSKTRVNVKQLAKSLSIQDASICKNDDDIYKNANDESGLELDLDLPTHIILDFSMISFIDSSGLYILKKIIEDYNRVNITMLIASMASHVASMVKKDPILWGAYKKRFYVTLSDAVHNAIRDNRLRQNAKKLLPVATINKQTSLACDENNGSSNINVVMSPK